MLSRCLSLSLLAALVSLAALPALAHAPTPLRVVANFLDLTEEQAQTLVDIRTTARELSTPLVQEIVPQKAALKELLGSEEPDPAEVGALVISIRELEREVAEIQRAAAEEFRSVLTEEQLQKYMAVNRSQPLCKIAPAFKALNLI